MGRHCITPRYTEGLKLARTQSKAFQALVQTCSENNTYEAILELAHKHGDALPNALPIFIGAQLRALQSRGRCLPADAHYIIGLTRPDTTGEGCVFRSLVTADSA